MRRECRPAAAGVKGGRLMALMERGELEALGEEGELPSAEEALAAVAVRTVAGVLWLGWGCAGGWGRKG